MQTLADVFISCTKHGSVTEHDLLRILKVALRATTKQVTYPYVWAFGDNQYSQCGHDIEAKPLPKVMEALTGKQIIQVCGGQEHTLILTTEGIYSCGRASSGALGTGSTSNTEPTLIQTLRHKRVVQIASGFGGTHSFALTDDHELYAWGYNANGELGLGHYLLVDTPQRVPVFFTPKQIFTGGFKDEVYCICLTNDGLIHGWGWNHNYQLGIPGTETKTQPMLIPLKNVKTLALGRYHTIALTEDDNVYAFGQNSDCQLGVGDTNRREAPTLLPTLSNKKIIQLATSGYSSFALTRHGEVYAWGWNSYQNLGFEDLANISTPKLVTELQKYNVISIAGGWIHTYVITDEHELLAFGSNSNKQLGIHGVSQTHVPIIVHTLKGKHVCAIGTGAYTCFAMTMLGK